MKAGLTRRRLQDSVALESAFQRFARHPFDHGAPNAPAADKKDYGQIGHA